MKKLLLLILICFAQSAFSQNIKKGEIIKIDEPTKETFPQGAVPNEDNNVYNTVGIQVKPEFPGGFDAFNKFIEKNFKIPIEKPDLKGKIYATFIIEKDGSLSNIKILRDIGYETAAEAIRVLKSSPKWTPGKQNDKLLRVLFSVPLVINNPIK